MSDKTIRRPTKTISAFLRVELGPVDKHHQFKM